MKNSLERRAKRGKPAGNHEPAIVGAAFDTSPLLTGRRIATDNESMTVSSTRAAAAARQKQATDSHAKNGDNRQLPRDLTSPPPYPIHRFTPAEYEKIADAGILDEDSNVELLEGWIVPKMTKYPPHDGAIDVLMLLLGRILPPGWYPRSQNVVVTADSEPEPDIVGVHGEPADYCDRHPRGVDIGLIIEVADSTVRKDRRKATIYARAGVPNYWIVNLDERQIEVYSRVAGKGKRAVYQSPQILIKTDDAVTLVLDGKNVAKVRVGDMLPKSAGGRNGK